ncbi:hypothetical protein H072_2642 [Dactylellina haptotyla CBS 200.50]|uniref:Uncharacterized protein n=1 Tax=Dactylellina haptotyla (strain CBS 200.50) TaxID=1284197 RepID=S8AQS3_DACHA|nr:hypothetical protein H072_2642 [Dactylellina haptotyla CBS 200.50]
MSIDIPQLSGGILHSTTMPTIATTPTATFSDSVVVQEPPRFQSHQSSQHSLGHGPILPSISNILSVPNGERIMLDSPSIETSSTDRLMDEESTVEVENDIVKSTMPIFNKHTRKMRVKIKELTEEVARNRQDIVRLKQENAKLAEENSKFKAAKIEDLEKSKKQLRLIEDLRKLSENLLEDI